MIERYTLPEMGRLWTEENKYRNWLEVEIAACQANAEAGRVPMEAVEVIRQKAAFSVDTGQPSTPPNRQGRCTRRKADIPRAFTPHRRPLKTDAAGPSDLKAERPW